MHKQANITQESQKMDMRVKQLWQLELLLSLLSKITGWLALSFILVMLFAFVTKAESTSDLFMVPVVHLTHSGAVIKQTQSVNGTINYKKLTTDTLESGTNFRPSKYDAFGPNSMKQKIDLPEPQISSAQNIDFSSRSNMSGGVDGGAGTLASTFTFTAEVLTSASFSSDYSGDFEYRWAFDNDLSNNGKIDTYYSHQPVVNHQFKQAGVHQVKLEVLDKTGHVSAVVKSVTVVQNTPPVAIFTVDKLNDTANSIFHFDTSLSSDSQYGKFDLVYRFDWDSDGQWDTNYQSKTQWNHLYREAGVKEIRMEVMDPEGAVAMAGLKVNITGNTAPQASIELKKIEQLNNGAAVYNFDASGSSDDHTNISNMRFRWDFNYTGENDIVFETGWSSSPKYSGSYHVGGQKTVRLQVMDEQGLVDEAFAQVNVSDEMEKGVGISGQL